MQEQLGKEGSHAFERAGAYVKDLAHPDETRPFHEHGHLDLVSLQGGISVGRAIFEPGWRWSDDVRPLVNTELCEVEHTGYCLEGTMSVRMKNGEVLTLEPGCAFHIPPGHDAWVEGEQACILLDIGGFKDYAKPHE